VDGLLTTISVPARDQPDDDRHQHDVDERHVGRESANHHHEDADNESRHECLTTVHKAWSQGGTFAEESQL
jgi:hypothetical protein